MKPFSVHILAADHAFFEGECTSLILPTVDQQAVASVVGDWTGIPVGRMAANEIETILNTEHDAIMTESETVDEGIANMNEQVAALLG